MTCRLVVILPAAEAAKPRFRDWQSERTSGLTVTKSIGFDDEDLAMATGQLLPYVWALETERRPA